MSKAYQCDICNKVYLVPDVAIDNGFMDSDSFYNSVPAELIIYHWKNQTESLDICKDCLDKLINYINTIREEE